MPNRPIDFKFTSDVVRLLNGLDKAELSVEDLEQAFVEASNSSQDLERKIAKATREAEQDVEKLERAIKDLPKATEEAADKADKDFDRMGDSARDAGKETGSEFVSNLGESISSGDFEGMAMGTLGGLTSSLMGAGPIGMLAGAGAALAGAIWGAFKAQSETMKAAVAAQFDLFDEVTGQIDRMEQFKAAVTELGGGDFTQGMEDLNRYAGDLGLSLEDTAALITGEINPATEETLRNLEAWRDQAVQGENATADQIEAYEELLATTELNREALARSKQIQQDMNVITAEHVRVAGDIKSHYQGAYEYIKGMDAGIRGLPNTFQMDIITTAKGPMAGYVSQTAADYSPGHVAIASQAVRNRAQ